MATGTSLALAAAASAQAVGDDARTIRVAQSQVQGDSGDTDLSEEELDAATAESSQGPPPGVEVMRIRGRGISGVETGLPESVTSFDAATIEALGAQDVSDLARVTPNVSIVQPGATQANFFIRGIGLSDFSANSQGAVAVFQDDVSLNAPAIQTGQLFDIQNVELVRGPQGTGPFRNASAGAIRVTSNLPTGNYGAQLRSTLGRYQSSGKGVNNGMIRDFEGYLEAPLLEDVLSSRFAFRLRNSDPYQTNGCGNAIPFEARQTRSILFNDAQLTARAICGERLINPTWPLNEVSTIPVGLPEEVDFEDNWAARGFLRLQPPDTEMDFILNAHGSRLDEDQTFGQAIGTAQFQGVGRPFGGATGAGGNNGYWEPDQKAELLDRCGGAFQLGPQTCIVRFPDAVPGFDQIIAEERPLDRKPYRGDYNRKGKTTRDAWGSYLSGRLELWDLELSLLGSFDTYKRYRDQDTDFTPDTQFEVVEDDKAWQTYEEVLVEGDLAATPLAWQVGAYYLQEGLHSESETTLPFANSILRDYSQDTKSFGLWAGFAWDFIDDLSVEGGVRYNWERKDFSNEREQRFFGNPGNVFAAKQNKTWQAPTGNLTLTYLFDEEVSAFLKYSRGFKAGHFNALSSEDVDEPPAKPEKNDAWEAGLNGSWFDQRLNGRLSYFYYRYQDYQIFLFKDVANNPPVLEIVNASEAENYGIEIEGQVEPLRGWCPHWCEGLRLTGNFAWLHGEFLDFQLTSTVPAPGTVGEVPIVTDYSGQPLLSSPEYTASGSASWTFDLGRWGYVIPRYDFSWTDDVYFGLNEGRGSASDLQGNPRLPDLAIGQPSYWLHNVRLAYRTPTGNVEVAVWGRNLEDTVYKTYAFDASNFSRLTLNFVGVPRTVGMDLIITF